MDLCGGRYEAGRNMFARMFSFRYPHPSGAPGKFPSGLGREPLASNEAVLTPDRGTQSVSRILNPKHGASERRARAKQEDIHQLQLCCILEHCIYPPVPHLHCLLRGFPR